MTTGMIVLLVMIVFFVLLSLETPIAFVLAGSGALGIMLLRDAGQVTNSFETLPFSSTSSYSFAAIPTFMLLGMFALHGGLAERTYQFASEIFGRFRGGLGIATVAACSGFAAVCGSTVATSATVGRLSVGEMVKAGYPRSLAAGMVAAAGSLGILIPPSLMMVFYAIFAEISIADMLLAGIVPGILTAVIYAIYVGIRAQQVVLDREESLQRVLVAAGPDRSDPAPGSGESDTSSESMRINPEMGEYTRAAGLRAIGWILVIFAIVMTGVFTGRFTVVESGAIGAVVALVVMLGESIRLGPRSILRKLGDSLAETASLTAMCFAVLVGAVIFTQFLVMARVPQDFATWLTGLDVAPIVIVIIILAALIPLGMALDEMAIMIILVPLLAPVIADLGINEIWFGILFIKLMEIGLIAPPVGMNSFVVAGASGVPVVDTYRGVLPFIALDLALVAVMIAFPQIILWLPGVLGG